MSTPADSVVSFRPPRPTRRVLVATVVSEPTRRSLQAIPTVLLRADLAATASALADTLSTLRPDTLVVGANAVDASAIAAWAAAVRTQDDHRKLLIIRRGTSLAAIDTTAAAAHGVEVVNTPEVNARHIARFVTDALLDAARGTFPDAHSIIVGLIGAGAINGRVARAAAAHGHRILVHTPSLAADPRVRDAWMSTHGLADAPITVARDIDAVFAGSDLLSIAVPLTADGRHPTHGFINPAHVKAFAGTRIVSISEPEVLTEGAVMEAYGRRELTVVIDNAPGLVDPLRKKIVDRFPDGGALRPGFTLSSAAMRMPGCGEELDQAFLTVVANSEIAELPAEPDAGSDGLLNTESDGESDGELWAAAPVELGVEPWVARRDRGRPEGRGNTDGIIIIGGGIVGLTIALSLHTAGRRNIQVLDAAPADRTDPSRQGTTYGGTDGRHLSLTETVPHADTSRRSVLARSPRAGGWQLRDPSTLDDRERGWVEAFEGFTDRAGLRALTVDLVVGLNRLGLRGWEALFARYPHVFDQLRRDTRLPRCYLSEAGLAAGMLLQSQIDSTVRTVDPDEITRRWPALATTTRTVMTTNTAEAVPAAPRASVHGAIEVDGYAVNIHQLADSIRDLSVANGVPVHAGCRVHSLHRLSDGVELALADGSTRRAGTVIVTVGGRDLVALLGDDAASSGAVQHVLGVSLTLPNPGLHHALKVHAPDPVGVVNITLSQDSTMIHASGGFGYLGLARPQPGDPRVAELMTALEELVGHVLPALRGANGSLTVLDRRTCERPMTPDGLPVLEPVDAYDGRVVVAAGTNAGGTVQAPALAVLLERLLRNEPTAVHLTLRPDRVSLATTRTWVSA